MYQCNVLDTMFFFYVCNVTTERFENIFLIKYLTTDIVYDDGLSPPHQKMKEKNMLAHYQKLKVLPLNILFRHIYINI